VGSRLAIERLLSISHQLLHFWSGLAIAGANTTLDFVEDLIQHTHAPLVAFVRTEATYRGIQGENFRRDLQALFSARFVRVPFERVLKCPLSRLVVAQGEFCLTEARRRLCIAVIFA